MLSLDELGKKHNTDKSSRIHGYLSHYEFFLSSFREREVTLLELGVGPTNNMGKSLLMWRDFFSYGNIVGVDIRPDTLSLSSDRIHIEIGDCGTPSFLQELSQKYCPHIIIDDASHKWSHQILAFELLWPCIQAGGIFICEDMHTSFPPLSEKNYSDCPLSAATYYHDLAILVLSGGRPTKITNYSALQQLHAQQISGIYFIDSAVIIKKKE